MTKSTELKPVEVVRLRATTKRGAAIRLRLLQCTTNLLSRHGYSATTVQLLSEEAEASRGSILHQFPTRLDLIAETLDFILERMLRTCRDRLARIKEPRQRLEAYADVMWDLICEEPGAAVSEILQAARWDPELCDRIKSEADKFNAELEADIVETARAAGIKNPKAIFPQVTLLAVTARGFTRELSFQVSGPAARNTMNASKANYIRFIREL